MCSETVPPRLSFSNDLSEFQVSTSKDDVVPRKDTLLLLDTTNHDFEFTTSRSRIESSSSADELFSNGMILPTIQMQQQRKNPYTKLLPPRPSDKPKKKENNTGEKILDTTNYEKKTHQTKSFWGFSRSRSLNCDNAKKNLTIALPPLPRSKSVPNNPKRTSSYKQQSSSQSSSALNMYPVPKSGSGKRYNGLRISPVLNVPTPCCISKGSGSSFFGLGSLLRVGKVKKKGKN